MKIKSYTYIAKEDQELFLDLCMQGYFQEAHRFYCNVIDEVMASLKSQTFGLVDFREILK